MDAIGSLTDQGAVAKMGLGVWVIGGLVDVTKLRWIVEMIVFCDAWQRTSGGV